MSASAQSSAGDSVRHFLRDVVLGEPGVEWPLAERLADRIDRNLDRVVELYGTRKSLAKSSSRRAPARPAFDPYCFGAVVTLERDGREALLMRLGEIDTAENLRELAEAQHLCVDPAIRDAPKLRLAIAEAAAFRIADRRAASSG
jgi:hypothetical protein